MYVGTRDAEGDSQLTGRVGESLYRDTLALVGCHTADHTQLFT